MKNFLAIILSCIFCVQAFAQERDISGRVLDDKGDALPYVVVSVEQTNRGTVTDINGDYIIKAKADATIVFQYVGYKTQSVNVANRRVVNIVLESETTAIDEVVVVGYGQQKKESVIGAIATTQGDDVLKSGGLTNVSRALSGLMSGVVAMNTTGAPGEDIADIYIRGRSTWNDSSPLVLIDGIEGDMNLIDPREIESISVLKDASATAVFGVRGGNGVVLITTKRGGNSEPKIRFSASTTMKLLSELPEFEGSYSNNWLKNEARELLVPLKEEVWASYTSPWQMELYKNQTDPYNYPDVDWKEATVKDFTMSTNYSLDVRGGSDKVQYFTSASYVYDADILNVQDLGLEFGTAHNDYGRLNFRTNFDYHPTSTTKLSLDISGNRGVKRRSDLAGNDGSSIWETLYGKASDLHPIVYEDGAYGYGGSKDSTPSAYAALGRGQKTYVTTNVDLTLRLNQNLDFVTPGLSFNAVASYKSSYQYQKNIDSSDVILKYVDPVTGVEQYYPNRPWWYFNTAQSWDFYARKPSGTVVNMYGVSTNLLYQGSLNYSRTFNDKHAVTALANFKRTESSSTGAFPSYREEWAGRVTYGYDSRYLVEANVGYNGSEKFDKGLMFGFFPSIGLGWVVSNEKFFKDNVKFMDFLKFRYSSGKVGSDAGITRWLYQSTWNTTGTYTGMGNTGASSSYYRFGQGQLNLSPYQMYSEGTIANPNATWEVAVKNNVAMETKLFKNHLSAAVDYYWNHRTNIFCTPVVPSWYGAAAQKANIGETKDSGLEVELKWNDDINNEFFYSIGVNVAYATNEVIYAGESELISSNLKSEGYAIGQVKDILNGGLMNNWDDVYLYAGNTTDNSERLPGYYYQIDYNGDGYISSEDSVPSGYSSNPEMMYGVNLMASYKGFTLSANFSGMQNVSYDYGYDMWGSTGYKRSANSIEFYEVWLPGREDTATMAAPIFASAISVESGDWNVVDGTTWRLKTIELSYTYPKPIASATVRLYLNANNLFLWNHVDMDIEHSQYSNSSSSGFGRYPMTKTITFGLDINL